MAERLWALLKTLIFTVLGPGTVTVVIPYYLLPTATRAEFSGVRLLGLPLIAAGAACYLWCAWNFAWVGLGTPVPVDPPRRLVVVGLYRYVRNPMYVSVLLVLLGQSVLFQSLRILEYAGVAWLVSHLFVLCYEEPTLRRKFGPAYEEYRGTVRRWIPRLRSTSRD